MRFQLLFILLLLKFSCFGKSQDSTGVHTYIGAYAGGCYNQGLSGLNSDLEGNAVTKMPELAFTYGVDFGIQLNRSKFTINFNGESINNRSQPPKTAVAMNCLALSLNYGFDLLGDNNHFRLEPFLGVGASSIEFFVTTHDSTATLKQILDGVQNIYYEKASLGLILDSGLRFEFHPKMTNSRIAYFGQFNYQWQLNQHQWSVQDMPLSQLSKFNFTLGARLQIKLPDKS